MKRVVSLLPSATEIVFALGCGDEVVGVTFECDYPSEARTRRIVSTSTLPEGLRPAQIDAVVSAKLAAGEDLYRLDEHALADLDADIVLTQDLCAVCAVDLDRVDDALTYLGCSAEVVTLDPRTLEEVLASISTVGAALGAPGRAATLVRDLAARVREVARSVAGAPRPGVVVLEWMDPPFSAGHWVPDLVRTAGGRSLCSTAGQESRRLAWPEVASAEPDVVLLAPCGYHLADATAQAAELMQGGRVPPGAQLWAVDADSYFVRPGPRLVDGAELVAQILHPDLVGGPDPERACCVGLAPVSR